MAQSSIPLTSLTEAQRAQAQKRFTIIRPALEDGVTQAQVARTHNIPAPTVRPWLKGWLYNHLGVRWPLFIGRWSPLQRNKDGSLLATTASAKSLRTSIPPL